VHSGIRHYSPIGSTTRHLEAIAGVVFGGSAHRRKALIQVKNRGVAPTGDLMVTTPESTHMAELADTLWYERRLLEYLLFKLVSANLVLIADDRRFVGPAIAEVDAVMAEIRRAENQRSEVVAAVAAELDVPTSAVGLAFLVDHAPDSLRATFEDHRIVFMDLVGEIEVLTKENRRLATVALDGIQGTLGFAGGDIYDSAGRATRTPDHPVRVNRVM
jgi:hypothetical protein